MKFSYSKICINLLLCAMMGLTPGRAQKIKYCRQDVFISNPDHLQLAANIGGNHHLLIFNDNEKPEIFIYNDELELQSTVRMPFNCPERSVVSIIPFGNYYYIYIRPVLSQQHLLWRVDSNGNCTNYNSFFQKLLLSQANNIKLGFQLISYQDHLWMVYHAGLDDIDKNTLIMAQTDSLLNVLFTNRVIYDFKRDEERLQKEILIFGKYLLVLKTGRSGTALELLKVNLATGYSVTHSFTSSGYFYSQSALSISNEDSSVTVSALLTEPSMNNNPKQFVFVSRLNKNLFEEVPFTILRSQFKKNAGSSFITIEGQSEWMRFGISRGQRNSVGMASDVSLYQDLTMPDGKADIINGLNRMLQKNESGNLPAESWNGYNGVRFSLLDKNLKIANDTLVPNTKDSYTIRPDQFIHLTAGGKAYMLVGQQFVKKSRGLLMVQANDSQQLIYTDLRVNDRNDYLLSKFRILPGKNIIIPYVHKLEAGLMKISLE